MKLSFIIPYYEVPEEMLRQCIDSIVSLKSINVYDREIIVVDDGSRNDIKSLVEGYGKNVIYLRQENEGPGSARNRGLEIAQGEWIQFVDADDSLLSDNYDTLICNIDNHDYDMIMFEFTHHAEGYEKPTKEYHRCSGVDYMLHNNMKAHPVLFVFKKNILKDLRFERGLFHEDELFTPQLVLNAQNILVSKAKAYYYRLREGSTMVRLDIEWITLRLNNLFTVIKSLDKICQSEQNQRQKALRRKVSQLTMDYIYNIVTLTHSIRELKERLSLLRKNNLYPLPIKAYTWKYLLFSLITKIV